MKTGPQAVNVLLHTNGAELGAIAQHAKYLARVRDSILAVMPDSAATHIHVAAVDHKRVLLYTDNAGWATRLRYAEPALRRTLAQRMRLHTDRIITRVRPELAPREPVRVERHISPANREHMQRVAAYIDHPELARTLSRLAQHGS